MEPDVILSEAKNPMRSIVFTGFFASLRMTSMRSSSILYPDLNMNNQVLNIKERDGGVTIECIVTPRAGKSAIKGVRDGALLVSLAAPPVDGRANEALIELIAKTFSIPKSRISILRGERGRKKLLRLQGVGKDEAQMFGRVYRLGMQN